MIKWVHWRFIGWGEWMQKGQRDSCAGLTANWEGVGSGNFKTSVIPIRNLDSSRVNDWVAMKDADAQMLMYRMYCTGKSARQNAMLLNISVRTLYARLHILMTDYARSTEEVANKTDVAN
jgi:hypothetical protein